jgi:hypothetical protein
MSNYYEPVFSIKESGLFLIVIKCLFLALDLIMLSKSNTGVGIE